MKQILFIFIVVSSNICLAQSSLVGLGKFCAEKQKYYFGCVNNAIYLEMSFLSDTTCLYYSSRGYYSNTYNETMGDTLKYQLTDDIIIFEPYKKMSENNHLKEISHPNLRVIERKRKGIKKAVRFKSMEGFLRKKLVYKINVYRNI